MLQLQERPSSFNLTPEEVQRIAYAAQNFRDRCVINMLFWCGLRRAELIKLKIEDIDFNRKTVTVWNGKGNQTRTVPVINDQILADLRLFVEKRGDQESLFLSNRNKQFSLGQINHIVKQLGIKAQVKNPRPGKTYIHPHLFRHAIARHLKNQEMPMEWLKNFFGHKWLSTTMDVYGTMSLEDMVRIAEKKLGRKL